MMTKKTMMRMMMCFLSIEKRESVSSIVGGAYITKQHLSDGADWRTAAEKRASSSTEAAWCFCSPSGGPRRPALCDRPRFCSTMSD